jgi:hypothetical protein
MRPMLNEAEDPFYKNELADYEIIEVTAGKYQQELEAFV